MSRSVPPFTAASIEAICRELGDQVTGSQISGLISPLKPTDDDGTGTKWKRLYNAVAHRQNSQGDGRPMIRLVTEVMQPVRFKNDAEFQTGRAAVNRKLLLCGYEVREDGKVRSAKRAETVADARERADALGAELERRNVHPHVLDFCREEL